VTQLVQINNVEMFQTDNHQSLEAHKPLVPSKTAPPTAAQQQCKKMPRTTIFPMRKKKEVPEEREDSETQKEKPNNSTGACRPAKSGEELADKPLENEEIELLELLDNVEAREARLRRASEMKEADGDRRQLEEIELVRAAMEAEKTEKLVEESKRKEKEKRLQISARKTKAAREKVERKKLEDQEVLKVAQELEEREARLKRVESLKKKFEKKENGDPAQATTSNQAKTDKNSQGNVPSQPGVSQAKKWSSAQDKNCQVSPINVVPSQAVRGPELGAKLEQQQHQQEEASQAGRESLGAKPSPSPIHQTSERGAKPRPSQSTGNNAKVHKLAAAQTGLAGMSAKLSRNVLAPPSPAKLENKKPSRIPRPGVLSTPIKKYKSLEKMSSSPKVKKSVNRKPKLNEAKTSVKTLISNYECVNICEWPQNPRKLPVKKILP
jgi:hypothetical protein